MEPCSKKQKVDSDAGDDEAPLRQMRDILQSKNETISQHTKALKAVMRMLLDKETAFSTTGEKTWSNFPEELRNNPICVLEALRSEKGRKSVMFARYTSDVIPVWFKRSDLSEEMLRNNRQVALQALKIGMVTWDEVFPTREEVRQSKTLSVFALMKGGMVTSFHEDTPLLTKNDVTEILQKNRDFGWNKVPADLQDDDDFCRSVALIPDNEIYHNGNPVLGLRILRCNNRLRLDEDFWRFLVEKCPDRCPLRRAIGEVVVPVPLLNDREFVAQASDKDPLILEYIPSVDLVEELVRGKPRKLGGVSFTFVASRREFVVSQLAAFSRSLSRDDHGLALALFSNVPREILNDSAFSTAWLQAGLLIGEDPPHEWRTDRKIFLLLAQHCQTFPFLKGLSFRRASDELRNDAGFIAEAMRFDPGIFEGASQKIKDTNFELAVWALSDSGFAKSYEASRVITAHRRQAEQALAMHNAFVNPFLTSVCDKKQSAGPLCLLDVDKVKEMIGDFVGIVRGQTLCHIRAALSNIAREDGED